MIEQLFVDAKPVILQKISSATGLGGFAAEHFMAAALPLLGQMAQAQAAAGGFDASAAMKAGPAAAEEMLGKLDVSSIAHLVGGDVEKARKGVAAIGEGLAEHISQHPEVLRSLIGQMGLGGLKGMGAGLMGSLGSLASGLFRRK